jgi:hypothetical protein
VGTRTPLDHAAVPAATAALERVVADGVPYVVKTLRPRVDGHPHWPASIELDDPMWWRREADAYAPGLLPAGDLRAARCAWIDDRGDVVELWLEDVAGTPATEWPVERYGPAARVLGRWQGAYLAGCPLPEDGWLARRWLRAYVERRTGMFDVPAPARWQRVWDEREAFLSWVEGAPQTLSHLDFWSRNHFDDGGATVAIDWAFVGIAAAGEDASNLVLDAVWDGFLPGEAVRDVEALVWPEYLAGLRDAGAAPDRHGLRLAYAASAAVKHTWIEPWMIQRDAPPELWAQRRPVLGLVEELADEARELAASS